MQLTEEEENRHLKSENDTKLKNDIIQIVMLLRITLFRILYKTSTRLFRKTYLVLGIFIMGKTN